MSLTSVASEAEPSVSSSQARHDPQPDRAAPQDEAARPAGPPTRIAGRYEVDLAAPLGRGGMAVVYRGRDLRTRRDVAVKTLRLEYRRDAETRARFRREARLMAFLAHPNVVRVYDFVEDRGASWVVLEYLAGPSLRDLIAERGAFTIEETAVVLDQVAGALDHLHARGLVHLDVKPQNLLVTGEGRIKLIDFGLAQRAGGTQEAINGATFGTAAYLAPEQACGAPVEVATDVYALGCVVYELLTGRPPFAGGGADDVKNDTIRAHLERAPLPPSRARPDLRLPRWVDDVVLWALAKDPAARYGDAATFARAFRSAAEGEPVGGVETTTPVTVVELPVREVVAPPPPSPEEDGSRPVAPPAGEWRPVATAYRLGGLAARRLRPLRRGLWRATVGLALGNAMLAALLFVAQGRLPGVYEPAPLNLRPGVEAEVTVEGLFVRAAPGTASTAVSMVDRGERVEIAGPAVEAEGGRWWPVAFAEDGARVSGYVWSGGLAGGERETPWERFAGALGLE